MIKHRLNLEKMPRGRFTISFSDKDKVIGNLFGEKSLSYLNEYNFYLTYFKTIPNFISQTEIDCWKAADWFACTYSGTCKDVYYSKLCANEGTEPEYDDIFCVLYEDLLVDFDISQSVVRLLYRETSIDKVEAIRKGLLKFKKTVKHSPSIYLLIKGGMGIETKSFTVTKPKLQLDDNYNDDFKSVHKLIQRRLSLKNDKGIVLLHGKPGTGKTSYIRYLISSVKKKVIFLPPNMAASLTHPDLLSVLIDNPNSIFVVEDAENIVVDRESSGASPVSALLNIADGLLSDCLHIQIICSFNTDISRVDNALLRKGRMIAKYEFKELSIEKANLLSRKLGYSSTFYEPMTLSSVYNQEDPEYQQSRKKLSIGFRTMETN